MTIKRREKGSEQAVRLEQKMTNEIKFADGIRSKFG
jgi:hypothetical protein